jgi:hypothetical protein
MEELKIGPNPDMVRGPEHWIFHVQLLESTQDLNDLHGSVGSL